MPLTRFVTVLLVSVAVPALAQAAASSSRAEFSPGAVALTACAALAIGVFHFFRHSLRLVAAHHLSVDLPTSKARGVFIGLVELSGTAESDAPLRAPITDRPCVSYRYSITEHWEREVTETYTDSEGKERTRTGRRYGTVTLADATVRKEFYLRDETGVVLIRPERAAVEGVETINKTVGRDDPLYYARGPAGSIEDSCHRRTFQEYVLPLHAPLYIMGPARERQDIVAAEVAYQEGAERFLISMRSEDDIQSTASTASIVNFIIGWVLALIATAIIIAAVWFIPLALPVVAVGYFVAWGLGVVWLKYNSLVRLRSRVRQAWSQVDVQLKRRHDYIPQLIPIITATAEHEKVVQSAVAELRTQLVATPPGEKGPDFDGVVPAVRGVIEKYPALMAQEAFARLHRELVDTEQRVELARSYYNEIATAFATRLESMPDSLLAKFGGLRPEPLLNAAHFERAAVNVQLAT